MELGDPGPKFMKLDQLDTLNQLTRELMWKYTSLTEEMAVRGTPVSGRKVIWITPIVTKSTAANAYITSYDNLKEMPWYSDPMYQAVGFY